jgi:hypothetical protein
MSNLVTNSPFGTMTMDALLSADNLDGIGRRSTRWQIIEAFMRHSEGRAERIYEGSSGMILLIAIPGQPNTGAFYLYDGLTREFFMLTFVDQDNFNAKLFDFIVTSYDLGQFIQQHTLVLVPKPAIAAKVVVAATSRGNHRNDRRRFNSNRGPRVPQAIVAAQMQSGNAIA